VSTSTGAVKATRASMRSPAAYAPPVAGADTEGRPATSVGASIPIPRGDRAEGSGFGVAHTSNAQFEKRRFRGFRFVARTRNMYSFRLTSPVTVWLVPLI
jgi:hypothetical protein